MNGMKLGIKQKPKNSFVFQNQFLNYQNEDSADSDEQQDYEDDSQNQSHSNPSNNPKELNLKSKIGEEKKIEVNQPKINQPEVKLEKKEVKQGDADKKQVLDKRINNLNEGMGKLSISILEMKDNYQEIQSKQQELKSHHYKKQQQIKNYLERKRAEKLNLLERKNMQKERDRKKLEESLKLEEIEKANKQKLKNQENLKKINEIRERREAEKQKSAEKHKIVSQMYEKILQEEKINKKFHLRKMQQDRMKQMEQLQKRNEILVKRKQAFKSIDLSQLQSHQRRHEQILGELEQAKRARREEALKKIQQQNSNMKELYRGQAHDYVEEEMQQLELKKSEPKQKYKKMKEYQQYVRQNYIPKTQQPSTRKSTENANRNNLSHRQVRRYRYLNGFAYGEVCENQPIPKSDVEQRKMGNLNLAYLKSLPKRKRVEEESIEATLSPEDLAILDKKLNSIVRMKQERNPLYQRRNHHSMQVKISKNPTRDEVSMVFSQLKLRDEQTRMKQKILKYQNSNSNDSTLGHKKINEDIVKNIEQKLNLLALM